MTVILYRLEETDDSFEVGECLGEILLDGARLQIEIDDPELKKRLRELLLEPLKLIGKGPSGLSTIATEVYPGDPGYFDALRDRLQRRDFRVQADLLEE